MFISLLLSVNTEMYNLILFPLVFTHKCITEMSFSLKKKYRTNLRRISAFFLCVLGVVMRPHQSIFECLNSLSCFYKCIYSSQVSKDFAYIRHRYTYKVCSFCKLYGCHSWRYKQNIFFYLRTVIVSNSNFALLYGGNNRNFY